MIAYDVGKIRVAFNELSKRANEQLGSFDAGSIGIGRYVPESSSWERHSNGDELFFVMDGEIQIEVLENDTTSATTRVGEGSLCVVPAGKRHQLTATDNVNVPYISPSEDGAERTREHPFR